MALNVTPFVGTDNFNMETFNNMISQINSGVNSEISDVLAQLGTKAEIVYGSYTGTGTYGGSNQNQLTFSVKPLLVIVEPATVENNSDRKLRMLINVPYAVGLAGDYNFTNTVSWTDRGVQWYSTGHATGQFNVKDAVYRYVALLAADE